MQDNSTKQDLSILPKKDTQIVEDNVNNETNTLLEESSNLSPTTTTTTTTVQYSTGTEEGSNRTYGWMDGRFIERGEEEEVMSVLHRKWRIG